MENKTQGEKKTFMKKVKRKRIKLVINGQEIKILAKPEDRLKNVITEALKLSTYDSHRNISEFQINMIGGVDNGNGQILTYTHRALSNPIFVTLKAGTGA